MDIVTDCRRVDEVELDFELFKYREVSAIGCAFKNRPTSNRYYLYLSLLIRTIRIKLLVGQY